MKRLTKSILAMAIATITMSSAMTVSASAASYIGIYKAKTIARNYAGVSSYGISYTEAKLDRAEGVYDIEFRKNGVEYDFEINAYNGSVLEFDNDFGDAAVVTPPVSTSVTLEQAKTIALKHAGISASNATFVEAKKDYENGKLVYDLEFYSGNKEYDYEIDAATGAIVKYDYDAEKYTPPVVTPPAGITITKENAKTIALNHAGLSASNVRSMKVSKDWERGSSVYEVEFKSGRYEYEYMIRISDGKIIEWDREYDD